MGGGCGRGYLKEKKNPKKKKNNNSSFLSLLLLLLLLLLHLLLLLLVPSPPLSLFSSLPPFFCASFQAPLGQRAKDIGNKCVVIGYLSFGQPYLSIEAPAAAVTTVELVSLQVPLHRENGCDFYTEFSPVYLSLPYLHLFKSCNRFQSSTGFHSFVVVLPL